MPTIEKYCAPGVYDTPSYSQAIKVTGAQTILFLAGQVPYAPDGTVNHIGDFMGQARQVFGAVKALVEHAGGTLQNVVKTTVYLADMADFAQMNEVYAKHFGGHKPARSTVQAAGLPKNARVEIDAIAVKQ